MVKFICIPGSKRNRSVHLFFWRVIVYVDVRTALDKIPTPEFKTKVKIATVADSLQCYDVEYINDDKFIVDC